MAVIQRDGDLSLCLFKILSVIKMYTYCISCEIETRKTKVV